MQIWKFLLDGITGDLSKKKILPALAQFAEINHEKVQIQLIGYSRSEANYSEILSILNQNSSTGTNFLNQISFLTGQYDDGGVFFDLIAGLKEDERLINYLAIPPQTFVKILQNSCPFSNREIDIIIEKPFGRDLKEAQQMLGVIQACDLKGKVHFSDHYLFKTASHVSKAELLNFKNLKNKKLQKITINALESVDLKERKGYYEGIGALRDMFVHLFSLLNLGLEFYSQDEIDYSTFSVKNLSLGQYQSYLEDTQLNNSETDTYFQINSQIELGGDKIELKLESGKKLGQKDTSILLEFTDGSSFIWNVNPEKYLELISKEENLKLGLDKNNYLDHTNLFQDLLDRDHSRFVDPKYISITWEMLDKILEFKKAKEISLKIYKDSIYPAELV